MFRVKTPLRTIAGAALALVVGSSGAVRAQDAYFEAHNNPIFVFGSGNYNVFVDVSTAGGSMTTSYAGPAGIFNASTWLDQTAPVGSPDATVSVCDDLFHGYSSAQTKYSILTSDAVTNKYQLAYLVDHYMGPDASGFLTATAAKGITGTGEQRAAAFQLAVWEFWYDDGTDITKFGNGSATDGFRVDASKTDSTIVSDATAFLTDANNFVTLHPSTPSFTAISLTDVTSPFAQGMLISIPPGKKGPPVPEPAFYQLTGLLGMGLIGLRRLRRKR
jgi:hypothetical protein